MSVIPGPTNGESQPSLIKLLAANNTEINTYGRKSLTLDIGLRRQFKWLFTVADVTHAIIGADFLQNFNILVDMKGKSLVDGTTQLRHVCQLTECATTGVTVRKSDGKFHRLLAQFIDLTDDSRTLAKGPSDVKHFIQTRGPPVSQKVRRLSPEKLEIAKKEFDYLLDRGICVRSKSQTDHGVLAAILDS